MKIEGKKHPYELKLYSPDDPDFIEHHRFKYPYDDKKDGLEKDVLVATALDYLCLVHKGNRPSPVSGRILTGQFEFPLSYLKWFIAVLTRFQLLPAQGGYPVGQISDSLQLDEENWLYVQRGPNYGLDGLFGYFLENRQRHSYINQYVRQSIYITDEYLFDHGLMEALTRIQQMYEDGEL